MSEQFNEIPGFPDYFISNHGRVRSLKKGGDCILQPGHDKRGYPLVGLWNNGKRNTLTVHRLVAKAFIPNPKNKAQVNHLDGIKTNNVASNLEWATNQENMRHAFDNGIRVAVSGEDHSSSKLNNFQIRVIRKSDLTQLELAEIFNVTRRTINSIINNKTYKLWQNY